MTTPGTRRRMSAEGRREQILDVTLAIIDAEGVYAATPNRIAEEAGVSRPVLYQQFGDLSALFVELVDREAKRAAAQFADAVARLDGSAEPGPFGHVFEGTLSAIDSHPATWRLFLLPPQGAPIELHDRLASAQAVVRRFLEQELRRHFPSLPEPEYTARMVQAAGRELLQLHLVDPDNATSERLRRMIQSLREWVRS